MHFEREQNLRLNKKKKKSKLRIIVGVSQIWCTPFRGLFEYRSQMTHAFVNLLISRIRSFYGKDFLVSEGIL